MWDLERDHAVSEHAPLLVRALRTVGAPGIRSRATLGGSLAWSDPTSQLPATLLALDATIVTTTRRVEVGTLLAQERGTALAQGELVVSIEIQSHAGAGFGLAHIRRSHITWPVAGAVALTRPGFARVALYGAAPRPIAVASGERDADAIAGALELAAPFADERAGAAYRTRVLPILAGRALAQAHD
jgi:carbon-monoxide dehydrogenase medium subunit